MKTETVLYSTLVLIIAFIIFAAPTSSFASEFDSTASNSQGNVDHNAMANFYENQAKEMQARIEEQIEALSHKPRSSFFGKHGKNIRKHVEFKIDQFEKAAEDNLQKAAYHKNMAAEQSGRPAYAKTGKTKG